MTARFAIRTATPADIPALRRLIEASVRGLQQNDYTEAQREGALGHALGLDTQLIADNTYFLAEPADPTPHVSSSPDAAPQTVAACGGWSFRRTLFGSDGGPGRTPEPLDPASDPAKIRAIFVHPAFARQGLGALLLRHCENAARAAGFRSFEMGSTLTGVPLYTREGYTPIERVEVPLPNGEHLPILRMTKPAT